jgi:hypothetical protein
MKKLSLKKLMVSIAFGVLFWFIGLMVIRALGGYFMAENKLWPVLLYVLVIPFNVVLFALQARVADLHNSTNHAEVFDAVAIVSLIGCFLDVVCVNFFRPLYAQPAPVLALGLVWLLWGVGTGLFFAYLGKSGNFINPQKRNEIGK